MRARARGAGFLTRVALGRVAFLHFGTPIDRWRWDVFSGKTPPARWNEAWWELRRRVQGLMVMSAGWQYDQGLPCGPAANAAKYLAGEAGFQACEQAVMTHGGFGYAREYHVERYLRESLIPRIAPISPQLVLSFIAEKVLGLPKSY